MQVETIELAGSRSRYLERTLPGETGARRKRLEGAEKAGADRGEGGGGGGSGAWYTETEQVVAECGQFRKKHTPDGLREKRRLKQPGRGSIALIGDSFFAFIHPYHRFPPSPRPTPPHPPHTLLLWTLLRSKEKSQEDKTGPCVVSRKQFANITGEQKYSL